MNKKNFFLILWAVLAVSHQAFAQEQPCNGSEIWYSSVSCPAEWKIPGDTTVTIVWTTDAPHSWMWWWSDAQRDWVRGASFEGRLTISARDVAADQDNVKWVLMGGCNYKFFNDVINSGVINIVRSSASVANCGYDYGYLVNDRHHPMW